MGSPGSSSPTDVTQTSVSELPEEVKPYVKPFLQRAEALSRTPFSEYGGEKIAGLNPYHQGGLDMVAQRAIYGDPAVEAGRGMLQNRLQGSWFDDPAFSHAFNRGADMIQGRTGSMFGSQGMTNSGVQQQTARDMNDFGMGLINQEQQRMPAYLQAALAYGQEPIQSAQALMGAGDILRGEDQARINEAIKSFEARRNYPFQMADVMGSAIRMGMGGGGTTTSTGPGYFQPSSTANAIGGALGGYGLGQQLSNSSYAGPLGGIVGGLAGMYI